MSRSRDRPVRGVGTNGDSVSPDAADSCGPGGAGAAKISAGGRGRGRNKASTGRPERSRGTEPGRTGPGPRP